MSEPRTSIGAAGGAAEDPRARDEGRGRTSAGALGAPDPVVDRLGFAERHLSAEARGVLAHMVESLERDVRPLIDDAWERAIMPDEVLGTLAPLRLMDPAGVTAEEADSSMFAGFRNLYLARFDVSVATAYNGQSGLFRAVVRHGCSPEQTAQWDPLVRSFDLRGAFALTEPEHGSDIAGGMQTRARRTSGPNGDVWVIDGAKRWIGGAASADVIVVFARDEADASVKCFLVDRETPGVRIEPIGGKVSLRPMQNAHITLTGVEVPDARRADRVNGWRDVAGLLRRMRSDVSFIAAGLAAGALDAALRYTRERRQFGKPIASFQLIQEKLARMLGNATSSLALAVELAAQQDAGVVNDENSALAKMVTAERARENAALAREVMGGNGILLEHDAARFFADAEAVYSYEGTHEVNSLIVGRSLTGESAFL